MNRVFLMISFFSFLVFSCDTTTSSRIEGIWLSRAGELSVLYEEQLVLSPDLSYTLDRKQDGESVYSEKGKWELLEEAVGDFEGMQRVIAFAPTEPKGATYKKMYSMENNGMALLLGTFDVETQKVESQRFYKMGDVK